MELQLTPLADFSWDKLTEYWNVAFTGYFVPVQMTPAALEQRCRQGAVDLSHSLAAFDSANQQFVGFSVLAIRNGRGWIGGFGIAPAYRGRGMASRLMVAHLEAIRPLGLTDVRLEVIKRNEPARRAYERVGFVPEREVIVFRGIPTQPLSPAALPVHAGELSDVAAHRERLGNPPTYQRELPYWSADPVGLEVRLAGPRELPEGLLVTRRRGDDLILVDGAGTRSALIALLTDRMAQAPGAPLVLLNEPEGSQLAVLLAELGVAESERQIEMRWRP